MKIGILGASGAVGRQMIQCLEEENFAIDELRLFSSSSSAGKKIRCFENEYELKIVEEGSFDGLDYVLGAVSNDLSKKYWPMIQKAGAVYVDNSSAFRLHEDVPLVVPEVNGKDALNHKGLIANPNCSTIITMMAVAPIQRLSVIESMVASTYQAVSGAGNKGIEELEEQIEELRENKEVNPSVFPKQIAYNCIAQIGDFKENGYTSEEMKLQNEGRKILHNEDLKVCCTCVRVPVFRSHCISVRLVTKDVLNMDEVIEAMKQQKGLVYCDNEDVPSPLQTSDQNDVYVGRLRKDLIDDKGLCLWCCGDQIRKGAAANAVQIIKYLEENRQD